MVFTSPAFLFGFLPVVLILHTIAPRRLRNALLLGASLFFYLWGSGRIVGILLVSISVDYGLGFVARHAYVTGDQRLRRVAVRASVVANVGLLAWFKYAGWLSAELDRLGVTSVATREIVLPVGISFFTFQSMSYTIDISRGRCEPLRNPIDFALFVSLFPQLIAGPIVRFHELRDQLIRRTISTEKFACGCVRFSHGLVKKVVVADTIAGIADLAFGTEATSMGATLAWLGLLAFTLQIYFDFSGYADMAIGLGMMLGFALPENFARPYSAYSMTDFWRRWHITLSDWFRDYVYIPLGGSRVRPFRANVNLVAVFALTGFWHGANWTFLLWGLYHGAWVLWERLRGTQFVAEVPANPIALRIRTFAIVATSMVLFRADSLAHAGSYCRALLRVSVGLPREAVFAFTTRSLGTLALGALVVLLPRTYHGGRRLLECDDAETRVRRVLTMTVGLPAAVTLVLVGVVSPFLYFQF